MVNIFLGGGLRQVDSLDYKPQLEKFHNKDLPAEFGTTELSMGQCRTTASVALCIQASGESGLWISELFPQLAEVADDLTIVNSMTAETASHTLASFQTNTGFRQMGFPAMGSWLLCGLGNQSDDLPSFVVLPDERGLPHPVGGSFGWSSGFLPPEHQGVTFSAKGGPPILDLQPVSGLDADAQRVRLELLNELNTLHMQQQVQTDALADRIHSYELAARMKTAIPEAMDFDSEPKHIRNCMDWTEKNVAARRTTV